MKKPIVIILVLLTILAGTGALYATGNLDGIIDKIFMENEVEEIEEEAKKEEKEIKEDINFSQVLEMCEKITNEQMKFYCIGGICDPTERKNKNKSEIIKECNNTNVNERIACYRNNANNKKNSEICQKIDYDYFKNQCLENSEGEFCATLKWQEEYDVDYNFEDNKNWCLAVAKNEITYCEKMKGGYMQHRCYADIAKANNDLSICDKIDPQDIFEKDVCYRAIAVLRKDISLCDKLNDMERKDRCYKEVALKKGDFSFCNKLSSNKEKGECYANFALLIMHDSDIYLDEEANQFCKKYFDDIQQVSRDAMRKSDIQQIATALETYFRGYNKQYPISNGLEKINSEFCILQKLIPDYLDELPIDSKNPEFWYGYKSNGKTYELTARLENLKDENCVVENGICLYQLQAINYEKIEEILENCNNFGPIKISSKKCVNGKLELGINVSNLGNCPYVSFIAGYADNTDKIAEFSKIDNDNYLLIIDSCDKVEKITIEIEFEGQLLSTSSWID